MKLFVAKKHLSLTVQSFDAMGMKIASINNQLVSIIKRKTLTQFRFVLWEILIFLTYCFTSVVD